MIVSAVVVALALLVTACSGPPSWRVLSPAEAALGDAVAALYLSPQARDFPGTGHVVLVAPDGSTRAIETSGMDHARLLWTASGLFFSDTERDYLLGEVLRSWPSPKTEYQDAALIAPDGSIVSVFNEGADGDGYTEQIVVGDGRSASRRYDVFGLNQVIAQCDRGLVGIAEVSGAEFTRIAAERGVVKRSEDDRPRMLTWLHPRRSAAREALIGVEQSRTMNLPWGVVPCDDHVVTHLVSVGDGAPDLRIRRWDTRTGKSTEHRLQSPDGPVALSLDDFTASVSAPELTGDGQLLWYGGDGVVRVSDPATGWTERLWDSGLPSNNRQMTEAFFQGRWLFLLDVPNDDQTRPLALHRRDALTGQGEAIVIIPGVNQQRSLTSVLRGVAVRPDLAG